MAAIQAQVTVPSNGSQVILFQQEPVNANQLNIRNTGPVAVLLGPAASLAPPANFVATPLGSGGTFGAGTYYWQITSLNVLGESLPSVETGAAIVTNGSCSLAWAAVVGATGYKIYRSSTSGGETTSPARVTTIGSGATVAFTDTGTAPSSGAAPITSTAAIPALFPLNVGEYLGTPVRADDLLVAQVQTPGTAGQITVLGMG